jgi:hypothetical protein
MRWMDEIKFVPCFKFGSIYLVYDGWMKQHINEISREEITGTHK